jgi:DNA modification methylase
VTALPPNYKALVLQGDNVDALALLEPDSVDSIVTDPPYLLRFMGKGWDDAENPFAFHLRWARAVLRVMKPGAYLVAFGGTKTYHWMGAALEEAGFEARDSLHWFYGSGWPKSKALLKPAHEPIALVRKPGPIRELNIDECRVGAPGEYISNHGASAAASRSKGIYGDSTTDGVDRPAEQTEGQKAGRWPANVLMDPIAGALLDAQTGTLTSGAGLKVKRASAAENAGNVSSAYGAENRPEGTPMIAYGDSGGASRFYPSLDFDPEYDAPFFYAGKASPAERSAGLDARNPHPTVKPVSLMRWLVRLITPPGGLVVDPFAGSGTTAVAALLEGRRVICIEKEAEYVPVINARIKHARGGQK